MPPPKKATAATDLVAVRAIHPVKHDDTLYGPKLPDGDTLQVSAQDAEALATAGAVEIVATAQTQTAE